jgi:hypothetical protein
MTQQKRLMFIVWNWREINKTLNEVVQWNGEPLGARAWKDKAYDEYDIAIKSSEGNVEYNEHGCKIIRIGIRYGEGDGMLPYILKIIDAYKGNDQKIFLFLHRSDGFTPTDVQTAVRSKHINKCFLFSNGRDFIYYNTQNIGLLGTGPTAGLFYYQQAGNGKMEVKVADKQKKIVFQPFFDRVWHYYEHEFETKITEIRSDILYYLWLEAFPDDEIWPFTRLKALLQKNEMLYLRVKNLLDKEYELTKAEHDRLVDWEIKQEKSFVFDDCRKNIERLKGVKEEYLVLHDRLVNLFFDSEQQYAESKPIGKHIGDLSNDFDKLLKAIAAN